MQEHIVANRVCVFACAVTCLPSQLRRHRNTGSSMKRWWPRLRRGVSSVEWTEAADSASMLLSFFSLQPGTLHNSSDSISVQSVVRSSLSRVILCLMISAELKEAQRRKKQLEDRCKLEESIGTAAQTWNQEILPNWSTVWVQKRLWFEL